MPESVTQAIAQQAVASQTEAPASEEPQQVPAKECYRIQFMSSTKLLTKNAPQLKGLWPVYYYQVNEYFRYTIGEAQNKADLQTQILEIRKNFPDAFVVHFDANGQRIK